MPLRPPGRAMLCGFAAIALWSTLASLTTLAGPIPPFQLAAITFTIGAVAGVAGLAITGQPIRLAWSAPPAAAALGVAGLLGYHALYFYALQTAPAIEANVVNYLWPLLIVMFSALLPARAGGKGLKAPHIVGALMGFAGALLALGGPVPLMGAGGHLANAGPGHLAALGAAIVWAAYSVASRLYAHVPSASIVGACALTAIGATLVHLLIETPVWPASALQWGIVLAMGLGPVGLAFTLWDEAVKHGDIRLVGVISYTTPLASNGLLTLLGLGTASPALIAAILLVTTGALIASRT